VRSEVTQSAYVAGLEVDMVPGSLLESLGWGLVVTLVRVGGLQYDMQSPWVLSVRRSGSRQVGLLMMGRGKLWLLRQCGPWAFEGIDWPRLWLCQHQDVNPEHLPTMSSLPSAIAPGSTQYLNHELKLSASEKKTRTAGRISVTSWRLLAVTFPLSRWGHPDA